LNWLDIVLGAILLFSGVAAQRNGLTRGIVRIIAVVGGVLGARWVYDAVAGELTVISSPALAKFSAFLGILFGCVFAGAVLAWVLDKFWGATGLRWFDRLLGGGFGLVRGWIAATVMLLGLVAFVPIGGVERAVAESNLAPLVLHGARAASYVAPAALRQAYSDNFEKVRQAWSLRPETAIREAAADSAKPDPLR
jgi:membrane protein required for colicin V production